MTRRINENKIAKIVKVLEKHPEGIWVRELARKSNLDKSLVSRYLNLYLKDKIKDIYNTRRPIRVVKLK